MTKNTDKKTMVEPVENTITKKKKRSFKEQKEFEALETEIMELEEKKSELENQMASSDFEIARKAGEEYTKINEKLESDYTRWEELSELE